MKLFREASRCYLVCLFAFALLMTLIGCSDMEETIENPVTVGSLKYMEETVPAAPQAPGIGKPFVKEIDYYKDWKLTKPMSGTVKPGTTFWIKVVFSEPVRFKPADDNTARPILYYRTGKTLTRFRIAKHGAGGEDFVSGDAKPWHSGTNDYICKYTVPKEATGKFVISVGKFNADKDGNTLPAFYTHNEKLQLGKPLSPIKSIPSVIPEPVTAGVGVGGSVPIQTAENVRPSAGSFLGAVYVPKPRLNTSARNNAQPLPGATVTIISGPHIGKSVITNQSGQYLFRDIGSDELHLSVRKEGFEPKEVIVSQTNPTTLPDRTRLNFRNDPQNDPSNILVGHIWPTPIRKILQSTVTVPDLLYVNDPLMEGIGFYDNGICVVNSSMHQIVYLAVLAHEIAHAYQDAHSGGLREWIASPEGDAFIKARNRDWAEVGKTPYDADPYFGGSTNDSLIENAAETMAAYWGFNRWDMEDLKISAPNRFKWAEEWLERK